MRFAVALLAAASLAGCGGADDSAPGGESGGVAVVARAFVGSASCGQCHAGHATRWAHSHHALAMQPATAATVLGDFADVTFEHEGVTTRFSRRATAFVVRTEGADGALADFEVKWTFGLDPLQQYLVDLGRGRLHALDIAWDARSKEQGGQRWIHLHPADKVGPSDPLHWTGANLQWNHMCAECHSTNVHKGYDAATDTFATTATEHGVGCEACHGPGERHLAWAGLEASQRQRDAARGLVVQLPKPAAFVFEAGARTAKRVAPVPPIEVEACARCHSRRTTTTLDYEHGKPLLDTHLLALLEDSLYFPDGQIQDEVFEYGSFVQSKMFHAGVTCSDCHDAHAGGLRAPGNELCVRCHDRTYFDQPAHHHHAVGTKGATCVECHMPERHYMVVDPRRDHSIRVPRPDLAVVHGTQDACTMCHTDKKPKWAADAVATWRGQDAAPLPEHWTAAIAAGRARSPRAGSLLLAALRHDDWPAIVRGTAASLLGDHGGEEVDRSLAAAARDPSPLVRLGAVLGLRGRAPELRVALLGPLLADPIATVRQSAAFALADCEALLTGDTRTAFVAAAREHDEAQRANAERDWAWVNRGLFAAQQGQLAEAERNYRKALRLDAGSVRAASNLADLLREAGRDDEGEQVLRAAMLAAFDDRPLQHVLGLLLVRRGSRDEAVQLLRAAATGSDADPRFGYVAAVALVEAGRVDEGIAILESVQRRDPWNRDVLEALVAFTRQHFGSFRAIPWARQLRELAPGDVEVQAMLRELESGK